MGVSAPPRPAMPSGSRRPSKPHGRLCSAQRGRRGETRMYGAVPCHRWFRLETRHPLPAPPDDGPGGLRSSNFGRGPAMDARSRTRRGFGNAKLVLSSFRRLHKGRVVVGRRPVIGGAYGLSSAQCMTKRRFEPRRKFKPSRKQFVVREHQHAERVAHHNVVVFHHVLGQIQNEGNI